MCQGHRLRESPESTWRSAPAFAATRSRTDADLEAARARLAETIVQLERERARAAEIRRRLAQSYAERDRIKLMASSLVLIRDRLAERRRRLESDSAVTPEAGLD